MKRNQYRKPEPKNGTKSSRKKNQSGEEGRRVFSEAFEENPPEEDPCSVPRFFRELFPFGFVVKRELLARS
jgi:hypothetical protein